MGMYLRGALAAILAACVVAVAAAPALADSSTIAGAPNVVPGTTYYGNLASVTPAGDNYDAYWLLPEQAGDQVTINWEAQNGDTNLNVLPSGTTDFNVGQTNPIQNVGLNDNDEDQLTFQTTTDGTLPLQFTVNQCCGDQRTGPYSFNVSIIHGMSVLLDPLAASLSGTAAVDVATPDGSPLSNVYVVLQASTDGSSWVNIGAAGSSGGVASIPYTVPSYLANQSIQFQAVGTLAGYLTTASGSQTINLPKEAKVPTTPTTATITTTVKISHPTGRGGLPRVGGTLAVRWRYSGDETWISGITARQLPAAARLTIACLGRSCPTQTIRVRGRRVSVPVRVSVSARDLGQLAHDLAKDRFKPGDRVRFTVSERGHRPTEGVARIRAGAAPDLARG